LQINSLLWLAKCPHEWGGPVSLENTLIIDIIMIPGGGELTLEVLVKLLALLGQMGCDDLSSEGHGLLAGNEELSAWHAFLGHALGGVV